MTKVSIRIGERIFTADCGQPLIDAIPDGEIVKGCLKGICRVCRCKLMSGSVSENGKQVALNSTFLPCISQAETDAEIKPAISDFQKAKIKSKTLLSDQVLEITLGVKRVFYNAKSVITLKHPEMPVSRSYSVVSLGKKAYDSLTFHVKLRSNGLFSRLFEALSVGDELDYTLLSPVLTEYTALIPNLNVVSGGSGMGAALTRALDLVEKYSIRQVDIYAINRAGISDYHLNCINIFRNLTGSDINITNIPFLTWTHEKFDIASHLAPNVLTVGVGSDLIISKLRNLPLCELESFG
ncbi:FAD-binding oxidoreductase [Xenorhabdus szentirmaii]|nr:MULTISPECIES: FAD-binding oxidoreductase [Xenorhabdus]MBD2791969.1 oxidoreductase [Xenorhabdus sp. CUL]MBD2799479.1 oxidoreductase [Xenorhabdus sp. M]MBD2820879.1 oxidoreductase [Xenorhabdus sp. 42]MBD2823639.1 oxidoreductase [Xenorhabdus sp. 5]PHM32827.1 CDP-6-deoxy-delta-3,4-glucoseen reductase [Xenorhabdus szentirmaii DSM 16338]